MKVLNKVPWAAKSLIFKEVSEISDIIALSKEERIKFEHTKKPIVTISAVRTRIRDWLMKGFMRGY